MCMNLSREFVFLLRAYEYYDICMENFHFVMIHWTILKIVQFFLVFLCFNYIYH